MNLHERITARSDLIKAYELLRKENKSNSFCFDIEDKCNIKGIPFKRQNIYLSQSGFIGDYYYSVYFISYEYKPRIEFSHNTKCKEEIRELLKDYEYLIVN